MDTNYYSTNILYLKEVLRGSESKDNSLFMKYTIPNQLTLIRIILTPVFLILFVQPDPTCKLIASIIF